MRDLLILIFLLGSCSSFGQITSLKSLNLTGPIRSISTESYYTEPKRYEERLYIPKKLNRNEYQEFDESGRLIFTVSIDHEGDTIYEDSYAYISDVNFKHVYFYEGGPPRETEYFMSGNIRNNTRKIVIRSDEVYSNSIVTYHDSGRLSTVKNFNDQQEQTFISEYEYSNDGDLTTSKSAFGSDTTVTIYDYLEFNEDGNWIMAHIINEGHASLVMRSFTYYEEHPSPKLKMGQGSPEELFLLIKSAAQSGNRLQLDQLVAEETFEDYEILMRRRESKMLSFWSRMERVGIPIKVKDNLTLIPVIIDGKAEVEELWVAFLRQKWWLIIDD